LCASSERLRTSYVVCTTLKRCTVTRPRTIFTSRASSGDSSVTTVTITPRSRAYGIDVVAPDGSGSRIPWPRNWPWPRIAIGPRSSATPTSLVKRITRNGFWYESGTPPSGW
jgi:hypothetical protein